MGQHDTKVAVRSFWDGHPCTGEWSSMEQRMEWLLEAEPYVSRIFTPDAFSGRKALEVGCGQGVETYLALQAGASSVVAGDLSYVSVSEARTNLFGSVPDRVRFLNFDAERLPFPDFSFDLVYSIGVLHHTSGTGEALREIHRVLKPDGKAIIMLYRLHCPKGYAVRVIRVVVSLLDRLVGQSGWTYERLVGRLGGKGNDVRGTSLHELLGCPILKLYSRRTLMPILSSFESISLRTEQPGFSRLWDFVPAFFRWQSLRTILLALDKVCAVWGGFYWVVEARKARG